MADSFRVRIPIGLALIAGISSLFYLDYSTGHGYGVIAVTTLAGALGLREYARMAGSVGPIPARSLILAGAAYLVIKGLAYELDPRLHLLLAPLVILFAYSVFFSCLQGAPSRERLQGLCATALGFFYIPFLGGFFYALLLNNAYYFLGSSYYCFALLYLLVYFCYRFCHNFKIIVLNIGIVNFTRRLKVTLL